MDENVEILLNSYKNIASVNADSYNKIELTNKLSEINEYDVREVVSATELFNTEREANEIYRIYGRIELMSLLNGLKNNYHYFQDFFVPQYTGNSKNILNSFDFYLVRPSTGYTRIGSGDDYYVRYFEVIATPDQFELFPVGFANNVFGEQAYSYNFNTDIDISNYFDEFGFPVTELFLYAQYKKSTSPEEMLSATMWTANNTSSVEPIITMPLNIGDVVESANGQKIGDVVEYFRLNYNQTTVYEQQLYITTPYSDGRLIWKYNPFISLRLRYLTNSVYQANTGSTSYELVQSIPPYAVSIDNGNYAWRNILLEGYFDPITGLGTDNPFVNKKRYLFTSLVLDIIPDLNDTETEKAFHDLWYTQNATNSSITPIGDINDIGKPCL